MFYRFTVEAIPSTASTDLPTNFDVQNHDDLSRIIDSVRSKGILDWDKSAALAIGTALRSGGKQAQIASFEARHYRGPKVSFAIVANCIKDVPS